MAGPSELTQHIESFVDTSRSPAQQAASLDAITSLVKNKMLTIEKLVREMEMYLTSTDNVIRARGILLLAELLTSLSSKPLDDVTIHSLIGFFTDRLADWRALRGALVGCLALLRRKSNSGLVTASDAKAVCQSYLQNLQVQSLAQIDRKLCFELLECLFERYPNEIASLGEVLIYGICEAVDEEKDPQCLLSAFRIIDALVRLFPDPSGPLASFIGDIFEFLSCYFPILFTHEKGEDADVKRDDLSRALMTAFSSSPLFEPLVIPLLLEKLASSLPSAKVDSLKYLSYCSLKYGADQMAKHAGPIWISLKDAIITSVKDPTESFTSESFYGLGFEENEITAEALTLLKTVTMLNDGLFLSLIVGDEDVSSVFNSISNYRSYNDIPLQGKQRLHLVGRILYVTAKSSVASCNKMFESFFPRLMDVLELSTRNTSRDCFLNFGALYMCIELLEACRDLVIYSRELASTSTSAHEGCFNILRSSSISLINALCSTLEKAVNEVGHDVDVRFKVKGLQILTTFPEDILRISTNVFENVLTTLMSIILEDFNQKLLWKLALKALVHIGSFLSRCNESEKAFSYMGVVVEKIVSSVPLSTAIPFPLKLEAVSEIGASGQSYMLKIAKGLEEAIFANICDVYVHGNMKSADMGIQLLQCYTSKIIPWICETGDVEEVLLHFAINIWSCVESWIACNVRVQDKRLLDATMMTMKLTVSSCSEESQNTIIQKACTVLSSTTSLLLKESTSTSVPAQHEGLEVTTQQIDNFSQRDEWILSLFAAVIIAVRPGTDIPNVKEVLYLFRATLLKGHVPSAQALGSMINKFGPSSNGGEISSDCTLEEAIDLIFKSTSSDPHQNGGLQIYVGFSGSDVGITDLCLGFVKNRHFQVHAIVGLAWIGKGLLLRGHAKVKDVIMVLLEGLLQDGSNHASNLKQGLIENSSELDLDASVMRSAADAFEILMSDSEVCLNRKFHATVRPLYKQRLFSVVMPILLSSIMKSTSYLSRSMLHRASAHVISDAPLIVVLSEAKKLLPVMLDGLSIFIGDVLDKEKLYDLLLVLSGILTDKNGQEAVIENAHTIINCLTQLIAYPHSTLVRETAIQCLVAMSELPYTRIYPSRSQVLRAISKAQDDSKRTVRQEAVKCRQAWASIASRSLQF
ncbi:hypothetical protein UlMin_018616 [Ulmus minor]